MLARATKALQEHVKDISEKTKGCGCVSSKQALKENLIYNNAPQDPVQLIHDKINDTAYVKGKLLGKGGFAKCYELTDIRTGKTYAGKIISKNRIAKPHQREKITREVELHKNLRHKHIVGFHSYFEDDDNVYIVLEVCSRKSLVHVLKSRKNITEPEVRYYVKQLVEGCRYIHNQRIIHRDLKLGNMLLNDTMSVKLADFGLATRVEYEGEKKMTVCGTPNYIAPEVLQKKGHSYEADFWAIGCIMYALLVGRPPFETSTLKETYTRITSNKYHVPSTVSPAARNLICKLLSSDPAARPTLDQILQHDFMSGYCPKSLSTQTCETAPKYSFSSSQRPKSYAAPVSPSEAMQKITASLSQLRAPKRAPVDPSPVRSRTKSADDLRSPTLQQHQQPLQQHQDSRITNTQSTNQLDHTPGGGRRPGSRPSSISSSQLLDAQTPAKRAASNSTLDSGHGSCRSPRSPSAASSDSKGPVSYSSTVRLYQMMTTCLEQMPQDAGPAPVNSIKPLWVTKWVDYSNKYGFGFQLSDKSVGVLFNDTTRMLLSADGKCIQYNDLSNRVFSWHAEEAPKEHKKKTTLLMYFAQYMDEHLIHGGDMLVKRDEGAPRVVPPAVFMKKWFRTSRAIVMYLSNGTLQVNFFEDHTKVVVSAEAQDYLVTFINSARQAVNYRLLQLRHFGCSAVLQERLAYARHMLERIINIEGEPV